MKLIKKIIRKQLEDFKSEEGLYVLNKQQRNDVVCSAISLETGVQQLQMQIMALKDAIKHGKDPEFWFIEMEYGLKNLERAARWIEEIMD